MHILTAAIASARIDNVFPRHNLTPAECIELAELWDKNDTEGLMGQDRERCEELMHRATDPGSRYLGPDERY